MTSASARPRPEHVTRILESLPGTSAPVVNPALVLMVGLPGSGKSTFARRLANATGATVLESDYLRRLLFESPAHDAAESRALFAALFDVAGRLLRAGESVIVDATNLRRSDRQPGYDLAAATGARLVIVHTSAPEAVVLERLRRRAESVDPQDHSRAGEAVYRHMVESAQPVREDHWLVPTSDEHASDAVLQRLIENLRLSGATRPAGQVTGGSRS